MNAERIREIPSAIFRVSPGSSLFGRAGLALSLLLAAVVTTATPAMAQTSALNFTDPLTGPTSPYLTIDLSKYTYAASGLTRTQSATGNYYNGTDRPMVTTVSGAFLSEDFEFDVDVNAPASNSDIAFVGFGQGVPNPSYFNEPSESFVFRIHNNVAGNPIQADEEVLSGNYLPNGINIIGTYTTGVTTTVRIVRSGNSVTMSVPSMGPTASHTYNLSDISSLTALNAHLFFGNSAVGTTFSNLRVIRAADTTPPVISSLTATPSLIWPPNHRMVPVTLTAVATDNVGVASLKIVSVTVAEADDSDHDAKRNESDDRDHEHDGDSNGKGNDARSVDYKITGDLTLKLRAEKGNVYTITVKALDAAGNAATKTVTVSVPHDYSLNRFPFDR